MCPICQVHGGGPCMQCDHLNRRRKSVPAAAAVKSPRRRPVLAVCPECGGTSTLGALLNSIRFFSYVQCPRCEIGTVAAEWRAPISANRQSAIANRQSQK